MLDSQIVLVVPETVIGDRVVESYKELFVDVPDLAITNPLEYHVSYGYETLGKTALEQRGFELVSVDRVGVQSGQKDTAFLLSNGIANDGEILETIERLLKPNKQPSKGQIAAIGTFVLVLQLGFEDGQETVILFELGRYICTKRLATQNLSHR